MGIQAALRAKMKDDHDNDAGSAVAVTLTPADTPKHITGIENIPFSIESLTSSYKE